MSISAITIGDQKCQADIKWLHQCFVLENTGDAFCILEFVAQVKKGDLQYFDFYIPHKVSNLENRTPSLLTKGNEYCYAEKTYELISVDQKNSLCGEIILDGNRTSVSEVSLEQFPTNKGTKLRINFAHTVSSGESRAVRLQFDYEKLCIKTFENSYSTSLKYYDTQDALFLNLDRAIQVNQFFVWLVFPHDTVSVDNIIPNFFQHRILENIKMDYMEVFYGSRTRAIWDKQPRKVAMWLKDTADNEPALKPWSSVFFHCEHTLQEAEAEQKATTKQEPTKEEKSEHIIYISNTSGIGVERQPEPEKKVLTNYLKNRKKYDIFIYQMNIEKKVKIEKDEILKSIELDRTVLGLLMLFLKYKDTPLSFENLYNLVWKESPDYEPHEKLDADVRSRLTTGVSTLRKNFHDVVDFNIPNARDGKYVCKGDFKFCLVIDKPNDQKYTL